MPKAKAKRQIFPCEDAKNPAYTGKTNHLINF